MGLLSNRPVNFNKTYSQFGGTAYTQIGNNGTWISFDTNPLDYDYDEDSFYATLFMDEALVAIKYVLDDLGFSDAVYERMMSTTWSQGELSDSNGKYFVYWTYHPDKGLEVMFYY